MRSVALNRPVSGDRFTTTSGSNISNGSSQMANAPNANTSTRCLYGELKFDAMHSTSPSPRFIRAVEQGVN